MNDPAPIFSPDNLAAALTHAVAQHLVPADKRIVVLASATTDGVKGLVGVRAGEHWEFAGEADLHGEHKDLTAGVSAVASW